MSMNLQTLFKKIISYLIYSILTCITYNKSYSFGVQIQISGIREGRPCNETEFSYYVYLQIMYGLNSVKSCGGSLISPNAVLTAAHCCYKGINVTAYSNLKKGGWTYDQQKFSSKIIIHPLFRSFAGGILFDVCVILFDEPFEITNTTKVVQLGGSDVFNELLTGDKTVYIAGYGRNEYQCNNSERIPHEKWNLQCAETNVVTQSGCYSILYQNSAARYFNDELIFCSIPSESQGIDSKGDSGGPVIYERRVQVGIISWGLGPCSRNLSVYCRVDANRYFIERAASSVLMNGKVLNSMIIVLINFLS